MFFAVAVDSYERKVADTRAFVLHAVSYGDGVDAWSLVDQIGRVRVAVPSATAVDYDGDTDHVKEVRPITAGRLERLPAGAVADPVVRLPLSS